MTRKDFTLIANVIHWADVSEAQRKTLAHDMAGALSATSPRFDKARFVDACLPNSSPYKEL